MCLPKNGRQKLDMSTESAFAALHDIRGILSVVKEEDDKEERIACPDVQPLGASLKTSLQVLQCMDGIQQKSSLTILCGLPISWTSDLQRQTIDDFISLSLECCIDHNVPSAARDKDDLVMLVLKRTFVLLEFDKGNLGVGTTKGGILKNVFMLRSYLDFSDDNSRCRDVWLECLRTILDSKKNRPHQEDQQDLVNFISDTITRTGVKLDGN
jgi:hypothetical protein